MRVLLGLLAMALCGLAIWWLAQGLAPVKQVRLAAGGQGGGYWQVAERYRTILARDGITLTVIETAGSVENVRHLNEGSADVALLQGGIAAPAGTEALAALFPEPLLLFARTDAKVPRNPGAWQGLAIAAGAPGSGTRHAADTFFAAAGHAPRANTTVSQSGAAAAQALVAGEVDIALFVAPLSAPYLQPLFDDPAVTLLPLDYLAALISRMPQSERRVLPAGAVTLDPPVPAADIALATLTARLVARDTLHPSLVDRLVEAAREIHDLRDPLVREGDFPTLDGLGMPVNVYAQDLLRNGTSPLQDYLPYWVVAQINRFAILLVPVFLLLLPILRALPGLYQWRMRARVFRYYQEIREIDTRLAKASREELPELARRLEQIDRELTELPLPLPYRGNAYTARMHLDLLRRRIETSLA